MAKLVDKTVKLKLVGLNGNAFVILGAFRRQAEREKWTNQEIAKVTEEAMSGDYDHLLAVIMEHCENGGMGLTDGDDEDEYDDE